MNHSMVIPCQAPQRGRGPLRLRLRGGAASDEAPGAEPGAAVGGPRGSQVGPTEVVGNAGKVLGKYGKCGTLLFFFVFFGHILECMER